MDADARAAALAFLPGDADPPRLEPLGQGLINDTYRVFAGGTSWVLQRINRRVFPDPAAIMANLRRLSAHARRARQADPDSPWRLPELLSARAGGDYHVDAAGEVWRAMSYLAGTHSLTTLAGPAQAEQVGLALGWFHALVSDLPPVELRDTLPGFHVTPGYLAAFDAALARRPALPGDADLDAAVAAVERGRARAAVLEDARAAGRLRPRVIHGDPKLDNVLFDRRRGIAVSLIDLDTVKPGLLHYDFGDAVRSCCARGVAFDLELFAGFLRGYAARAGASLTAADREYLFEAVRLLPYELGLRFLTDHLQGDVYFKVDAPGRNLRRALEQLRLARVIEAREPAIRRALAVLG